MAFFRQPPLVLLIRPSSRHKTEGRQQMMTTALIREPLASIRQMLLTIEMSHVRYTPKVATKKTAALEKQRESLQTAKPSADSPADNTESNGKE